MNERNARVVDRAAVARVGSQGMPCVTSGEPLQHKLLKVIYQSGQLIKFEMIL